MQGQGTSQNKGQGPERLLEKPKRTQNRPSMPRVSEAEFRLRDDLIELASDAILVRSRAGGAIEFWNAGAEKLYQWKRDEALGRDMHELMQTVFPVPRAEIEAALTEHREWHGTLRQRTRSGQEVVVACRKTLSRDGSAVLEVNRDITLQLRAEEALRASEKLAAMGRVAGIIAHEINNPLAAVINLLYLLRRHPSLDEDARRLAAKAEEELLRASQITRQTLSFYRESKQPVSVRVHELLDDVLELHSREFQTRRIEVDKQYARTGEVLGFPVELRQVFLNLISNAVQAMPEGGTLRLHVREATDWSTGARGPMVSIVDTGVGIQPEDARRLFEPFFSTKAATGTGLGLWISRGIVQKYDGSIRYRSHRHGTGYITCFRVFLPRQTAEQVAPPPDTAVATRRRASRGKRQAGVISTAVSAVV